uniref:T cell receptor alpha variable 18 n=1 Tax=Paramormyrops kingsleyae TaxID=1676925 RepID=A0A3B3QRE2_9TELE
FQSSRCSGIKLVIVVTSVRGADNAVNQSTADVIVYEGASVTLNCTYKTTYPNHFLFWYIQYPNDSPKLLQRAVENPKTNHPVFRLSAEPNKDNKRVDLELSSAEVTDSAVYYCALRPTVTGNSLTLYKNLTLGIMLKVLRRDSMPVWTKVQRLYL